MARSGQRIYNPITHEQFTILQTTKETNGERLVFECRVTPGGARLAPHVHDTQEERFEVISGTLGVMLGGERSELGPGQKVVLPARIKHQWWVAGDEPVHFRVEVLPARNLEAVLEALAGMAEAGKLNQRAMPRNPFRLAQLGKFSETYLPGIPIWMQKIGLSMGSAMGRVLGYDPTLAEFRAEPAEELAVAA